MLLLAVVGAGSSGAGVGRGLGLGGDFLTARAFPAGDAEDAPDELQSEHCLYESESIRFKSVEIHQ